MCDETGADGMVQDYGDTLLLSDTVQAARKRYRCDECIRDIEPGHRYARLVFKSDDGIATERVCLRCNKLRAWLRKQGHAVCVGMLIDDVQYCAAEIVAEQRKKQRLCAKGEQ